ncbi:alpha/beta-hydrolase [Xylariomycetidae sp. FL2044]|nr:alpha/beta-hydrolase [Xylariomycetidae sp. FL2044]
MTTPEKPALLIVHGAWHVPDSYVKLTGALRAAGFEPAAQCHLATDSDLIRSYATSLAEAGRTVAVIMHSYGGQVGTNALYGLSVNARAARGLAPPGGGVSHLIYMAGFALPEGKSMVDKVEEFGHLDRMPVAFGFAEDRSCVPNYPRAGLVGEPYADEVDAEELQAYIGSLVRSNGACMYQGIQNTPAWRDDVGIGYIHTLGDLTLPVDYQRSMVQYLEKEGKTVQTVDVESGHCPNLTKTGEVVDAIIKFTSQ